MPETCPHCGAVLLEPPVCCDQSQQDHADTMHRENDPHYFNDDDLRDDPDEDDEELWELWDPRSDCRDLSDGEP